MGPATPTAITEETEEDRAPFLGGRMRRETALLLGAKCADDGLADLDLPEEFSRTKEWRAALQRGDFIPTFEMVNQLDGLLAVEGRHTGYTQLAVEIESFPLGERARHLRRSYDLEATIEPIVAKPVQIGSGLSPYAESIRARDRLLVTGPLVRAVALIILQVMLVLWVLQQIGDLSWPAVVGLPALVGFALVPSLPLAEKALAFLCRRWRSDGAVERMEKLQDDRKGAGLAPSHPGCWHQDGEGVHLLSDIRDAAQRNGLAADSLERMTLVFGLNAAIAVGLLVAAALEDETRLVVSLAGVVTALTVLGAASFWFGYRAQLKLVALIQQGLGIP